MKLHHNWTYSDNLLVINFFYRHYKYEDYELLIKKIAGFCKLSKLIGVKSNYFREDLVELLSESK